MHIDWFIPLATPGSLHCSTQQLLVDVLQDHGITQVINEATRLANILDFHNRFASTNSRCSNYHQSQHQTTSIVQEIPLYIKANWQAIQHLDISNLITTSNTNDN